MSLRIWLPLNNSLYDKISHINLTPSGTIGYGDGKVTPKALSVEKNGWIKIPYKHIDTNKISIAFWLKTNESVDNWSDIFSIGGIPTTEQLPSDQDKDRYIPRMEIGATGGDGKRYYYWYGNIARSAARLFQVTYNEWMHVAIVADGTSVKFFKNGIQEKIVISDQWADESPQDTTVREGFRPYGVINYTTDYISIASRYLTGNSLYNGYINDFRVYDHALSHLEVYELSRGLSAHYQLKGMGRTNLLSGASQYTKSSPLTRTASINDSSYMGDSYIYHTGITFTAPLSGDYTFLLKSDGSPCGHDRDANYSSNKGFCLILRRNDTSAHPIWQDYSVASDNRIYGVFKNLEAGGTYVLRTNLYAGTDGSQTDYSVNFWDMKVLYGGFDDCEVFKTSNKEPDAAGYSSSATIFGNVSVYGNSPRNERCYKLSEGGYISCGSGAKVKDQLTVSCWGYMDDWSQMTGTKLLSCTEGGGWNFRCGGIDKAETPTNPVTFVVGVGTESNTYLNAEATSQTWSGLSRGWHLFTGTYDGYQVKIYIDGQLKGQCERSTIKNPIYYNPNNSFLIGIESGALADTAEVYSYTFKGLLSDVRVYGMALTDNDILALYQDAAYVDNKGNFLSYDFALDRVQQIEQNGVSKFIGLDEFNTPTYEAKHTTLPDGTTWARIHHLDVTTNREYFSDAAEVEKCLYKSNRYSRFHALEKYKKNNEYEFMLTYPRLKRCLPAGFVQLEYIEATGSQYIDTGVSGGARWEFDIQFSNEPQALIPPQTSNDQMASFYGTSKVFSSLGETHVENAYKAFDADETSQADVWYGQAYQPGTIVGYEFRSAKVGIKKIKLNGFLDTGSTISSGAIECKIDGEWLPVVPLNSSNFQNHQTRVYEVELPYIEGIRASATSTTGTGLIIKDLNVYGAKRQLMGYGGNAGEYWGKQTDETYGLFAGNTPILAINRDSVVHNLENVGKNYLWVQDYKKALSDQISQADNGRYWIFDISSGNGIYACAAKLYACRCIQGDTIREYVPAKRLSDNAIGLCDVLSGSFYTSATSTPLLAGPTKTRFLQYIQSNGNQTLNTGILPSDLTSEEELRVELKVSYDKINTDPNGNGYNQIMGFNGHAGMGIGIQATSFWECSGSTVEIGHIYNLIWKKKGTLHKRIIDGVEYPESGYATNGDDYHSTTKLTLFSASLDKNSFDQAYHCSCKLYSAKIYIGDQIVRDFKPYINALGIVGLLDLVEGRFYSVAAGQTLVAGPPEGSIPLYNRWIQTSNPRHASVSGDFMPIHTSWETHFGPLRKYNGRAQYHCESLDDSKKNGWYSALGQTLPWEIGDIPAANGDSLTETELWVRVNKNETPISEMEIYEDNLITKEYIEI